MGKFTKVASDAFQKLQLNAGILTDGFTVNTATIGNIIGATTGGVTFSATPNYIDFGEDVDNVPNGMMELKKLDYYDVHMTGNFVTCTPTLAKKLIGSADIDGSNSTKVIPRDELKTTDFADVWWIGDYSDVNTDSGTGQSATTAGYIAIHLMNALNTSGFQITSTKNGKGQLAFDFQGHYSIDAQDTVPFEIYVKAGTAPST